MRMIPLGLVLAASLAVTNQTAQAQRPAHFSPARPTFSTFLLYRQFNATGIPNYYQYVRPETQYREYVNRTTPQPYAGRQRLTLEQEVARTVATQLRQRETTGIGQPAIPAQFNNTSHFYQPRQSRRR